MWLECHIFPGGALTAENVIAAVHSDHLKVVFSSDNLLRSQFSEFRGERDEAAVTCVVSEDAGLEGLTGFFIDECSDLHPTTSCELQQIARGSNGTHIKLYVVTNLG